MTSTHDTDRRLLDTLSRICRAAGLAPVVLAPLLAGCEVEPDAAPPFRVEDQNLDHDDDLVPDDGMIRAAEAGPTEAEPTEPHNASATTHAVRPVVRVDGIVAPGHVAHFDLSAIPPESTVSLYAGIAGGSSRTDGHDLDLGRARLMTTVDAGIDGEEFLRLLIPERVRTVLDDTTKLAFQIVVEDVSGHVSISRTTEVLPTLVTPDRSGFDELHPGADPEQLAAGDRFRACVPEGDYGGVCPAVAAFDDWQALEVVGYALDANLPADLTASACIEEDAFAGSCCYVVEFWQPIITDPATVCAPPERNNNGGGGGGGGGDWWYEGRPFHTDAGRQEAPVRATSAWSTHPDLAGQVPEALRPQVVKAWTAMARAEHASVASFARMVMELLALGAPAELVTQATQAQLDEVRHAQLAFGVASSVAQRPIGPGPFDIRGALDRSHDLAQVLTAAIVEGCISETVASVQVRDAADHAADPILATMLHGVADDELRHAELSWAFVRWMLAMHPELHPVAVEAFASFDTGPAPEGDDDDALSDWGVRPSGASHALGLRILEQVVRPAADALLGGLSSIAEA